VRNAQNDTTIQKSVIYNGITRCPMESVRPKTITRPTERPLSFCPITHYTPHTPILACPSNTIKITQKNFAAVLEYVGVIRSVNKQKCVIGKSWSSVHSSAQCPPHPGGLSHSAMVCHPLREGARDNENTDTGSVVGCCH
jgi:hypothetical protein